MSDRLRKVLREASSRLYNDLVYDFFPVPKKTCDCGKAVVIRCPHKQFTCSRCGSRFELIVQIRKLGATE